MTADRPVGSDPAEPGATNTNKAVVRRLIEEVVTNGHLDVLDELYDPPMALRAHRWFEPFLTSFSDVVMRTEERLGPGGHLAPTESAGPGHRDPRGGQ